MKNKVITAKEAAALVKSGDSVMVGGFLTRGTPELIIDEIVASDVQNLTLIANDTGFPGLGQSKLIASGQVKTVYASHIGTNPQTGSKMSDGSLEVNLTPQGTLAEKIRAAGFGLGGILTPTGVGTDVAIGKEVINVAGKDFLLETALRGNVAIVRGSIVDTMGNVYYKGTSKNFCPLMCMACDTVIVEADELVEPGTIPAEDVMTHFICVDYIVMGGAK